MIKSNPIFVHSLWRSGSTYIYHVFRRSKDNYWAYQEPVHEVALNARNNPSILDELTSESSGLRHPSIGLPYFYELKEIYPAWSNIIKKNIIYDEYFGGSSDETLKMYLTALINNARGRPVIQECRTSCRIGTIKNMIGGVHIYLWRNPWDQWWSLKINEYFDTACLLCINATNAPKVIYILREEFGFTCFHDDDINNEFGYFSLRKLSSGDNYVVFYVLWCLGMLEARLHADVMLSIDKLSKSEEYKKDAYNRLSLFDISGLDFSDCNVPNGLYLEEDSDFFLRNEIVAHKILVRGGFSGIDIKWLCDIANDVRNSNCEEKPVSCKEIGRIRKYFLDSKDRESERLRQLNGVVSEKDEQIRQLNGVVSGIYNSRSWRITKPLRSVSKMMRR